MPFEQVRLEGWLLEVDAEATRRAYREAQLIDLCGCQGCRNYGAFARSLPTPILGVFSQLGIDPAREGEVWVYVQDESGQHLYGGFYPLVGSIIARPEPLSFFPCSDVFYLYFTEAAGLVPAGFPHPVLQMGIQAAVPWQLEESSLYARSSLALRLPMGLVRVVDGRVTEVVRGQLTGREGGSRAEDSGA